MTTATETPPSPQSHYAVLAGCSLGVIALVLMQLGLGLLMALLAVMIGVVGIMARWWAAVVLQLIVLTFTLHYLSRFGVASAQGDGNGRAVAGCRHALLLCKPVSAAGGAIGGDFPARPAAPGGAAAPAPGVVLSENSADHTDARRQSPVEPGKSLYY